MLGDDERDSSQPNSIQVLDLSRLRVVSALGRGAKGVVFLARDESESGSGNGELLALKVILRDSIEKKNKEVKSDNGNKDGGEYKRVCFEQQVLQRFNHPLLPRLRGVLATEKVVGYAIDYCPGRDLHSLRKRQTEKMFSDDIIRFYAAEFVLVLEYLHSLGIVYRDLKPDNIMVQENGHIMLVDFDLSTKLSPKSPQTSPSPPPSAAPRKPDSRRKKRFRPFKTCCNSGISPLDSSSQTQRNANLAAQAVSDPAEKSNSFVGTEEYVAPEIISGQGHDFAVDWWSLGVVLYEMLYGATPFKGSNRKETFYRILTKTPELVGETTPLRNLIGKLLEKDPKQRIALEGIKGHEFFRGIDWEMVLQMPRTPYIPAENGSECAEGLQRIEVELFVQRIFAVADDVDDNGGRNQDDHEHDKIISTDNNNNAGNVEKRVGIEVQNQQPREADQFFVF